jgi:hypothetical protein
VGQRAIHKWAIQQLVPAHLEYLVEVARVLNPLLELGKDLFYQSDEVLLLLFYLSKLFQ